MPFTVRIPNTFDSVVVLLLLLLRVRDFRAFIRSPQSRVVRVGERMVAENGCGYDRRSRYIYIYIVRG